MIVKNRIVKKEKGRCIKDTDHLKFGDVIYFDYYIFYIKKYEDSNEIYETEEYYNVKWTQPNHYIRFTKESFKEFFEIFDLDTFRYNKLKELNG